MPLKLSTVFYFFAVAAATRDKYRLIGGSEAKPHEFSHMVILDRDDPPSHFCGGGILNKYWVITAGHCPLDVTEGQTFRIKAGKHSLSIVEKIEQVINVAKVFIHEQFSGDVDPHDIALLKLEEPLVFNKYVKPITLPVRDSQVGGEVILTGWGQNEHEVSSDRLQEVRMTVIDLDTCKKILELLREPLTVTDTMLCTKSSTKSIFACLGDSGDPLIKQENNQTYLVGIFSWFLEPCGLAGAPSGFTKVSSYIDWIENITSKK